MCSSKINIDLSPRLSENFLEDPLIPGLPDDVAKMCLAFVPHASFASMRNVCQKWRFFIQSKEFITLRRNVGMLEEWIYFLTKDVEGKEIYWEVMDCLGRKLPSLPPMPSPSTEGFNVIAVDKKLVILPGLSMINGSLVPYDGVYQYDSYLNSWSRLEDLNFARYGCICAEMNGLVYVMGGFGVDGECLSSAEVYDPKTGKWTFIESLRHAVAVWGGFASSLNGKLYVIAGHHVQVYNPQSCSWHIRKIDIPNIESHIKLGNKLFCITRTSDENKMSVFNAEDYTWEGVHIPLLGFGSSWPNFKLGKLNEKILLFSRHNTLLYDPDAAPGTQWKKSEIKPSRSCVCSVTITF